MMGKAAALVLVVVAAMVDISEARLNRYDSVVSCVPNADCKCAVKVCYQSDNKLALQKVTKINVFNPCNSSTKIVHKTCADAGYTVKIGPDPMFHKLDMYIHAPEVDKSKMTPVDVAMDLLQAKTVAPNDACWKGARSRGIGRISEDCNDGEEKSMEICYPKCNDEEEGIGPVCWSQCTHASYTLSVGVLCCKDKNCETELAEDAAKIGVDLGKIAMDRSNPVKLISDLKNLYDDAKNLAYPLCSNAPEASVRLFEEILF